jgi:hypothetical protein
MSQDLTFSIADNEPPIHIFCKLYLRSVLYFRYCMYNWPEGAKEMRIYTQVLELCKTKITHWDIFLTFCEV